MAWKVCGFTTTTIHHVQCKALRQVFHLFLVAAPTMHRAQSVIVEKKMLEADLVPRVKNTLVDHHQFGSHQTTSTANVKQVYFHRLMASSLTIGIAT
jgi:hypothetical protein